MLQTISPVRLFPGRDQEGRFADGRHLHAGLTHFVSSLHFNEPGFMSRRLLPAVVQLALPRGAAGVSGLNLNLRLLLSSAGWQKCWIVKSVVWCRILDYADEATKVGFKGCDEPAFSPFALVAKNQIPWPHALVAGQVILFSAAGPRAEVCLREALRAAIEFEPADWDSDGFYVGRGH
jgi:hypothetical protein